MALRRPSNGYPPSGLKQVLAICFSFLMVTSVIAASGAVMAEPTQPLSTPAGCELVVGEGESIQQAIDAASPGDTICVQEGIFEEALTIDIDDLSLVAADGASPTLQATGESTGISVGGADVLVAGFEIRDFGTYGIRAPDDAGNLTIRNNRIEDSGRAIWLGNRVGDNPVIEGNELVDNSVRGIHIGENNENAVIRNNDLTDSGPINLRFAPGALVSNNTVIGGGIAVWDEDTTVRDNHIINGGNVGISFTHNADHGVIEGNTVEGTGTAIRVTANNPEILNNVVTDSHIGLELDGSATAVITDNELDTGIVLDGSASILDHFNHEMAGNTIGGDPIVFISAAVAPEIPADAGQLIIVDSSDVTVSNLSIDGTAAGIQIAASQNVVVSHNEVSNTSSHGIRLWSSPDAIVTENTLSHNGETGLVSGIGIHASPNADVSHNTISGSDRRALTIRNSPDTTVEHNILQENYEGLFLAGSDRTVVQHNTITETHHGSGYVSSFASAVLVIGSEQVVIQANNISNNEGNAIHDNRGTGSQYVTITENVLINNGNDGVYWTRSHDATISYNTISGNSDGIRAPMRATVTDNTVSNNWGGISASHDSVVARNLITDNNGHGVDVNADAIVRDNTITDNGEHGIFLRYFSDQLIENNTVSGHVSDLTIYSTERVSVIDNTFETGVLLRSWAVDYDELATHTFENNTVGGDPLVYAQSTNNPAIPEDAGQVIIANSTSVTISGTDISGSVAGIQIAFSNGTVVTGNTLSENAGGFVNRGAITLWESHDSLVHDNDVLDNHGTGIEVIDSPGTTLSENTVTGTDGTGILIDSPTDGILVTNNSLQSNDIGVQYGGWSSNDPVNATNNWWGHQSGPSGGVTDPETGTVAEGSGDEVGTNVRFDPWVGESPDGEPAGTILTECTVIDEAGRYVLTEDLTGSGACLEITSDDVIVDGNGHQLSPSGDDGTTGILLTGVSNVSVTNIDVRGWETAGITLQNAQNVKFTNITAINNPGYGLYLDGTTHGTFETLEIANNGDTGIQLEWSFDNSFTSVSTHGSDGWHGVRLENSHRNEFTDISVVNNARDGISITHSNSNVINSATIEDNGQMGIRIAAAADNEVFDAEIRNNSRHGISLEPNPVGSSAGADSTTIEAVTVELNSWGGVNIVESNYNTVSAAIIRDNDRIGLNLRGSSWNSITDSVIEGNRRAVLVGADMTTSDGDANYNTFTELSIWNNTRNSITLTDSGDFSNPTYSVGNELDHVTFENDTVISFEGRMVEVTGIVESVSTPADYQDIGQYVGIIPESGAWVDSLVFHYDQSPDWEFDDSDLTLWRYEGDDWIDHSADQTIGDDNTISVSPGNQLGVFAPLLPAADLPAPELSVIDASVSEHEVHQEETITVEATVENVGDLAGNLTVPLEVNGSIVNTMTVELAINESTTVEFTHTFVESGEFDVSVGGVSAGTVLVLADANVIIYGGSVDANDITTDDVLTISGDLYNSGDLTGNETITLEIDGQPVANQTVEVAPGIAPGAVSFTWSPTVADLPDGETSMDVSITLNGFFVETVTITHAESDIQVIAASVADTELIQGQTTHVIGSVYQAGSIQGTETIELTATHNETGETTVVGTQEITVYPGTYHLGAINISFTPDDPGHYDLQLGGTNAGWVDVEPAVSDIQVIAASTTDIEILQGETTHVIGSVYQAGNVVGTETIELTATHNETGETTVVGTQEITVAPGTYHLGAINISFTPDEAGHYDLQLGGTNAGWVDVEEAYSSIQVIAAAGTDSEIIEGETTHVIGSVYQAGNIVGTETIELTATHNETGETTVVGSQEITVAPGTYHLGAINISFTPDEPGHYDLQLGGINAGWVDVEPAVSDIQVIAAATVDSELIEGETTHVIGSVYQAGNIVGTEEIELTATHNVTGETTVVGTQEITVAPGTYHLGAINISFTPDEAGHYDLQLGERNAGWVDVAPAVSNIQVIAASTTDVDILQHDTTHVIGSVYQAGNIVGTEEIELTATHNVTGETTVVGTQEITVAPGTYHLGAINISFTPDEPGHYDLQLGGTNAGWVNVAPASSDIQVIAASASAVEIIEGEEIFVVGSVYQAGNIVGTETIELTATHNVTGKTEVVGSQEITVYPGTYHLGAINISFTPEEAGTYDLTLGDRDAGFVAVEKAITDITVIAASTSDTDIIQGEETFVIGSVYQGGNVESTETIELTATHNETGETEVFGTQDITLAPGVYHLGAINISFAPDEPGTYTLTLGERHAGVVHVAEAYSDIQVIAAATVDSELIAGETTHVIGSVYQAGNVVGTETIELTATHNETGETTVVGTQEITVAPGTYHLGAINISFTPDEAGHYDLQLGGTNAGWVDVEPAVSDIQVIAAATLDSELIEGETTHVIGSVYQAGNIVGTQTIELTATHNETGETTVVGTQEITVAPGTYHLGAINISFTPDEPGHYDLQLGERNAGWVDVEEAYSDIQVIAAAALDSELIEGESTHVIGNVYQAGNVVGTQTIELTATHNETGETTVVGTQEITVAPGTYHLGAINISFTPDEPGHYDLQLGERNAGWVDVEEAYSDIQVIAASTTDIALTQTETTHVIGSVYQAGNIVGTQTIELTATHESTGETEIVGSQEITVYPGTYHLGAINISFTPNEPGTYVLSLGGQPAGTVTVTAATIDAEIVSVNGFSEAIDPDSGISLAYASDEATVDIVVEADLTVEEVTLLIDSMETTYSVSAQATHLGGNTWQAAIPFEQIPDDGMYALAVIAVDELGNAAYDNPPVVMIDREKPSLSTTMKNIDGNDATIVVESTEPLAAIPTVTAMMADGTVTTIELTEQSATRYTGTLIFDTSGEYVVSATGVDRAGNEGTDTASAVINTAFTLKNGEIVIPETGTSIAFDIAEDADQAIIEQELFLALSENTVNTHLDPSEIGVGFLTAELDSFIDYQFDEGTIEGATISMAIDETKLSDGVDVADVGLYYYDESAASWDEIDSTITEVGDTSFIMADVTGFSTYGALVIDDSPPTITATSPTDGETLKAGTTAVNATYEFADDLSGIDVRSITIVINGESVTQDENTSITGSQATHLMAVTDGATYTIVVTVADTAGNEATYEHSFTVAEPAPPSASFEAEPTEPSPGETVTFDASESVGGDGALTEYHWDFTGDGTIDQTTTDPVASYTFEASGEYEVSLEVVNDAGLRSTTTLVVSVVAPQPPVAGFGFDPANPAVDDEVAFDAGDSSAVDSPIVEYQWDFTGDGTIDAVTSDPTATYVYSTAGEYAVTLTVIDEAGLSANSTKTVSVAEGVHEPTLPAPIAAFDIDSANPFVGDLLTFDASSSSVDGGEITEYRWDFTGDGSVDAVSTGAVTTHSFDRAGSYDVTLTVVSQDGTEASETMSIEVLDSEDDTEEPEERTPDDEESDRLPGFGVIPLLMVLLIIALFRRRSQ